MTITKKVDIITNPKMKRVTQIHPMNDSHIYDTDKFEVIITSYSEGELVILIPRTHIKLTLPKE